jgi:hypothetical protein
LGNESEKDPEVREDLQEKSDGSDVEARLEELAEEIAVVLESCPADEREAWHDYAVSLVRERLPVAADNVRFANASLNEGGGSGRNGEKRVSAGYGLLLLPVGFIILPVLPPVGVTVMLIGAGLVVAGVFSSLLLRMTPSSRGDEEEGDNPADR